MNPVRNCFDLPRELESGQSFIPIDYYDSISRVGSLLLKNKQGFSIPIPNFRDLDENGLALPANTRVKAASILRNNFTVTDPLRPQEALVTFSISRTNESGQIARLKVTGTNGSVGIVEQLAVAESVVVLAPQIVTIYEAVKRPRR